MERRDVEVALRGCRMTQYVRDNKTLSQNSGTGSLTITPDTYPTAGNTLTLEIIVNGNDTIASNGVTDSKSNTWTFISSGLETTSAVTRLYVFYTNQDVGMTITHGTGNCIIYAVREWAGKCVLDQKGNNVNGTAGTSATVSTSAGVTTQGKEFVLASYGFAASETSWTGDSNYVLPTTNLVNNATQARALASQYRDISTPGCKQRPRR
jgi:hypothetical protein